MKIAVCVKAVPDAASGRRIEPATNRLDRSGELTMILDDGVEILLKEGDYLVQGGVAHGWANRSGKPCIAECLVIGVPRE